MITSRQRWIAAVVFLGATSGLRAQDGIPADQFGTLRELILPHADESKWREVNWLTSLHEARVQAAEGKPILLWSGGGAPPLGGC